MFLPRASTLQRQLAQRISDELKTQRYSLLKAGSRSGKNLIAHHVIGFFGGSDVAIYSNTVPMAKQAIDTSVFEGVDFHYNALPRSGSKPVMRTLAIIDNAMWLPDSHSLYVRLRDAATAVFVMSSRGPEFDKDPRWRLLPGHSFSSWDLNPQVSMQMFQDSYAEDPEAAVRDFCAF